MSARKQIATVAAFVLVLVAIFLFRPTDASPPHATTTAEATPAGADPATGVVAAAQQAPGPTSDTTRREGSSAPGARGRGDLVVRLLYGDDRSPAADVLVTAFRKHETPRNSSAPSVDSKRCRTDAAGIARFPSMRAGRTGLIADRGHWYEKAYVLAGKETEVEFVMPVGVTVRGVVVSALGVPVAGAQVDLESTAVTTTDGNGRFSLRGVAGHYSIGARALGHGPSKAQQLLAHDGTAEVRLELGAVGGVVEGLVVDPDGKALADVRVDIGRYEGSRSWVGDAPPRPARARTDVEGRFSAIGIPPGEQRLTARAPGCIPWSGTCVVNADAPAVVHITFTRGNTLRGTLRDAEGHPCGDVYIETRAGEFDWDEVVAPDGTFEVTGLPDGEVVVKVDAESKGEVSARVQMLPGGAVTRCDLTLVCGFVARGKVRDEAGRGIARANVRWRTPSNPMGYTFTDDGGAFAIANTPEGKLTLTVDGAEIDDAHFEDLDARAGELDLRVKRRAARTAYIAGLVLDAEGRPAVARAWASGGGSRDIVEANTNGAGFFEIGPVAAGEWQLVIETRTFPRVQFPRRSLEPSGRWDVGTVRLAAGGEVQVEVVEGLTEGVGFSIFDSQQRWFGMRVEHGKGTSEPLPVGNYRLLISGKTRANRAIPFEIRGGETTKLAVRLLAGVRQQFVITLPTKLERPQGSLRICRGGELEANAWARQEDGKPCTAEVLLEPGDYTVVAKFGELQGSAAFPVGEAEGAPVRITVPQ